MPDANGRIRGISVPRIPWLEDKGEAAAEVFEETLEALADGDTEKLTEIASRGIDEEAAAARRRLEDES